MFGAGASCAGAVWLAGLGPSVATGPGWLSRFWSHSPEAICPVGGSSQGLGSRQGASAVASTSRKTRVLAGIKRRSGNTAQAGTGSACQAGQVCASIHTYTKAIRSALITIR